MDKEDISVAWYFIKIGAASLVILISIIWCFSAGGRMYDVWAQKKEGEAEYARAESSRQIKTLEAKAAEESAKYLAQAEVIRAHGVAEANKIIGQSLNENESYLRYLYIQAIKEGEGNQIIYVPTEAGLPLLEASRLKK